MKYHDSHTSDTEPWVCKSSTSKLKLSKVTNQHDRNQSDQVIEHVGKNHWKRKQELVLGLFHVQHFVAPSSVFSFLLRFFQKSCCCSAIWTAACCHLLSLLSSEGWSFSQWAVTSRCISANKFSITRKTFDIMWVTFIWCVNSIVRNKTQPHNIWHSLICYVIINLFRWISFTYLYNNYKLKTFKMHGLKKLSW